MKQIYRYCVEIGGPQDSAGQHFVNGFFKTIDGIFHTTVDSSAPNWDATYSSIEEATPLQLLRNIFTYGNPTTISTIQGRYGILIKSTKDNIGFDFNARSARILKAASDIAFSVFKDGASLKFAQENYLKYALADISRTTTRNTTTSETVNNTTSGENGATTTNTGTVTITNDADGTVTTYGGTSETQKTVTAEEKFNTTGTARPTSQNTETTETDTLTDNRTVTVKGGDSTTQNSGSVTTEGTATERLTGSTHATTFENASNSYNSADVAAEISAITDSPYYTAAKKILSLLVPWDETDRAIAENNGSAWWGDSDDIQFVGQMGV